MSKKPWDWEISDLALLLGQAESLRVEYKKSAILNKNSEKTAEELSIAVSSLANTEGGIVVIGVEERKEGKSRIASNLDEGINIDDWSPERIQQLVEANIYPPLIGLRFRVIFTDPARSRYYLVIVVPKGSTAYQARDFIYYQRSEFESKPLRDHEIRLRMYRGKMPEAVIRLKNLEIKPTNATRTVNGNETIHINGRNYGFDVILNNIGEVNINNFKVKSQFTSPEYDGGQEIVRHFRDGLPAGEVHSFLGGKHQSVTNIMVFPGDEYTITKLNHDFDSEEDFFKKDVHLIWSLYLPDRLPVQGSISLSDEFCQFGGS